MENITKVYLDQEGYEELLDSISRTVEKLNKITMGRSSAYREGTGNIGDEPEFEILQIEERRILHELQKQRLLLSRVEIIEKHNNNEFIDIGDIVRTEISADDYTQECVVKLVGKSIDFDSDINEVTINSPLGGAIYKKNIGEDVSYNVQGKTFNVHIAEKLNENNLKKLVK